MKSPFIKPLLALSLISIIMPFANANNDISVTTMNYTKSNLLSFTGTDITRQHLPNIPTPNLTISQVVSIPTIFIPATTDQNANQTLDVSLIDDFINQTSPMARHYPPKFNNHTERHNTKEKIKIFIDWLDEYAKAPNASYDVLLRATKLNAMALNLDLGSEYAVQASNYVTRAMKINDSAEANFLYGAMLSEGGGFREGAKYLEKAEKMGYAEAIQSLAQTDLLEDKRDKALQRLTQFKAQYPDNPYIDKQLDMVNNGQYYIWDILIQP